MVNDLIEVRQTLDKNNTPWYISTDGVFKHKVEEQLLKDDMSQEAVDTIFNNATRILSQCPNPRNLQKVDKTGLIIGRVQSGKTSNFISVLALAFDNGYDIAVVLGGNTLDLLSQNATRIEKAFNMSPEELTVLNTSSDEAKSLINADNIKNFITTHKRKIIIVGLKHHTHIDLIANVFEDSYLASQPVIVVDDEGDQATMNSKAFEQSMSSTYQCVLNLKKKLERHCFLSVTATPQANILINMFDKLSPDFGELIYPGEGYCGLEKFYGTDSERYVRVLPPDEINLVEDNGIPESLLEALSTFFVGNAIRRSRGDNGKHAMLIHPTMLKTGHEIVKNKVANILQDWVAKAEDRLNGQRDSAYSALHFWLCKAYDEFVAEGVQCVPFDDIEIEALNCIVKCSPVLLCNSNENTSSSARWFKTNIFVGGNLVERGITIKGLAVTYIIRRSKGKTAVDTMEQRARWFGYKDDYIDVCRVFMPDKIKQDFISILEHEDDMWATIERSKLKGEHFKDMPRIFVLANNYLQMTRPTVARTEHFDLSEWHADDIFPMQPDVAFANHKVITTFRQDKEKLLLTKKYNNIQVHKILEAQCYTEVYDKLISKLQINTKIPYFIYKSAEKLNINPIIDIYWVRDITHSTRKILEGGHIQQLFQGRNPNCASASYYIGDRALANNAPNHMQLQIHYIKPTNMPNIDYYTPIIAIYLPEYYAEQFNKLVVRTNG